MSGFVLIPGSWMGEWLWEPVTQGLRAFWHRIRPIMLSGLAEFGDIEGWDQGIRSMLGMLASAS